VGDGSVWEPGQRGDNSDESRFALRSVMVGRKPPLRLTDSRSLAEQQKSAAAQVIRALSISYLILYLF
jgi:hypothetical protein